MRHPDLFSHVSISVKALSRKDRSYIKELLFIDSQKMFTFSICLTCGISFRHTHNLYEGGLGKAEGGGGGKFIAGGGMPVCGGGAPNIIPPMGGGIGGGGTKLGGGGCAN